MTPPSKKKDVHDKEKTCTESLDSRVKGTQEESGQPRWLALRKDSSNRWSDGREVGNSEEEEAGSCRIVGTGIRNKACVEGEDMEIVEAGVLLRV